MKGFAHFSRPSAISILCLVLASACGGSGSTGDFPLVPTPSPEAPQGIVIDRSSSTRFQFERTESAAGPRATSPRYTLTLDGGP